MPLKPQHTRRLLNQFATVVRATVKGNVVVALVQGTLGGLAFWVLGINGAAAVGRADGAAVAAAGGGRRPGLGPGRALPAVHRLDLVRPSGLTVWGVLVIGLVDNVLRPILVGKETRLPDYLVLIATLGGLAVFGLNGFVIGPVIAALFIATWDIFTQARQEQQAPARNEEPRPRPNRTRAAAPAQPDAIASNRSPQP